MAIESEKQDYRVHCDETPCSRTGSVGRNLAQAAKRAKDEGFVLGATYYAGRGLFDRRWLCPTCAERYEIVSPDDWITRAIEELKETTRPRRDGRIEGMRSRLDMVGFMWSDYREEKLPHLVIRLEQNGQ